MYTNGHLPARKIYLDFLEDEGSSLYELPLLNERKATEHGIHTNTVIPVEKKEKNILERAIKKISCSSCFGMKRHKIRKSKVGVN